MYITGEADPILSFIDPNQRDGANAIMFELCRLNPHLDQSILQKKGTLPPYIPLLFPEMKTANWTQQQHEVNKAKIAPTQKRQMMHYVQQNPAAFHGALTILEDLNAYNREFVLKWKNPLEMPKIAAPLSIVDELAKQGGERIKSASSYRTAKKFLNELSIQEQLAKEYNQSKKATSRVSQEARAAYNKFREQQLSLKEEFPKQLAQLPKDDKKWITSPSKGYKSVKKWETYESLDIKFKVGKQVDTKVFGQRLVSYNTMEKMLSGAKVINRSLFALGVVSAGADSYVAAQKGEDPIRPLVKFGAGYGGAIVGGELGIAATGAIAAASGVSAEAVMVFLACTPWGWVALGVIVGTAGYFGSQVGEEYGLKIYDEGKKFLQSAEKTIADSWDAICEHAASLYNNYKWW